MPSRYPTHMLPPALGLNVKDDPYRLQPGELISGTNIKIHEDGSFERVRGYTNLFATDIGTTEYCVSIAEFDRWDGSVEIFVLYDTSLKKVDSVTWSNRNAYLSMSGGKRLGYVTYGDRLLFGNAFDVNKFIVPVYRHYQERDSISTADATNTATAITLASGLHDDYVVHLSSVLQHNIADATNVVTAATVTGLATCITWANDFKSKVNTHRSQVGVHQTDDDYHAIETVDCTNAATLYTLINEEKLCYNQHIEDGRVLQWGITAPVSAATMALTSGGSLASGEYSFCYTYYNVIDGYESPPSPVFVTDCAGLSCNSVVLSAIGKSTDPQVTHKRIYRSVVDGASYYRVDVITNVDTSYSDVTSDGGVGVIIPTEDYTTIPQTRIFLENNNRIYMAGSLTEPYRLYFTQTNYPFYFKATNYLDFDIGITALAKLPSGLIVWERSKLWFMAGTSPYTFSKLCISENIGCTNQHGWCNVEGLIWFISDYGVYSFDGANLQLRSNNINPDLLTKNLDDAAMVYDAYNKEIYLIMGSM